MRSGDAGHEIHAVNARPFARLLFQRFNIELAIGRMGDDGIGHAFLANERGECACIEAAHADNIACLQPLVEMTRGAMIGRLGDRRLHDHAANARLGGHIHRLDIFLIRADIADMGKGEGNDLARIGWVGEDFLITCDGGVEADFADRMAGCAEAEALDHSSICKHEQGGCDGGLPTLIGGFVLNGRGHGSTPSFARSDAAR